MAVNLEELRKKYDDLKNKKGGGGDVPWMTLDQGDNLIRLLSDEDGNFYQETGYHYLRNGKEVKAVTCNKLTDGTECYLCEVVHELYKSKSKADKDLAKEIKASTRVFFNVLDRSDGEAKVLGAGTMIFKEILKFFADPDWGDLTDPVAGHDLVINKTGEKLDTEYSVMPKPKPTKLGVEVELFDLSSLIKQYSVEEQEALFNGATDEDIDKMRAKAESKKPSAAKVPERKSAKPEPEPEPEVLDPEAEFADKIALIDLGVPKAQKALNNWLADEDRTEEELDAIVDKFPKDDDEPAPAPVKKATAVSAPKKPVAKPADDEEGELDAEIAAALAKFKKNK